MDDDCVPAPDCLERLLAHHAHDEDSAVVFPWWIDAATGTGAFLPAWCGLLVSLEVVARVGLPRRDLVWWTEDTEYLSWRMREAGIQIQRARDAVVEHRRVRDGGRRPPWKVYYEARNTVFYRLRIQHGSLVYRSRRMLTSLVRLLGQVLVDRDRPLAKLNAYVRGVFDGFAGRLGMRVPLVN
jgi:GT2 family glycosyltransferase